MWDAEEVKLFQKMVQDEGPGKWESKAQRLGSGRTAKALHTRWMRDQGRIVDKPRARPSASERRAREAAQAADLQQQQQQQQQQQVAAAAAATAAAAAVAAAAAAANAAASGRQHAGQDTTSHLPAAGPQRGVPPSPAQLAAIQRGALLLASGAGGTESCPNPAALLPSRVKLEPQTHALSTSQLLRASDAERQQVPSAAAPAAVPPPPPPMLLDSVAAGSGPSSLHVGAPEPGTGGAGVTRVGGGSMADKTLLAPVLPPPQQPQQQQSYYRTLGAAAAIGSDGANGATAGGVASQPPHSVPPR